MCEGCEGGSKTKTLESQVKDRVNEGVQGTILDEMIELAQKDGVINKEELTELIEKHQQESQELELKKQQQDQIAIKPRLDYLEKIKNFLDQTTIISKFSFIKEAGYENKDGFDKFTKYLLTLDENKQQRIIKVFKDNNDTENKIILDDYLDEDIGFGFPCNNKSYDVFIEKFEKLNKTVNEEQKVSNEEQKVSNEKQEKLNVEQEKSKKRTNLINEVSSKLKTKYTNLLPEMESKAIIELDNKGIKKEQIRKDIKEKNQTLDENKINELVETEYQILLFETIYKNKDNRTKILEEAKRRDVEKGTNDYEFFSVKFRDLGYISNTEFTELIKLGKKINIQNFELKDKQFEPEGFQKLGQEGSIKSYIKFGTDTNEIITVDEKTNTAKKEIVSQLSGITKIINIDNTAVEIAQKETKVNKINNYIKQKEEILDKMKDIIEKSKLELDLNKDKLNNMPNGEEKDKLKTEIDKLEKLIKQQQEELEKYKKEYNIDGKKKEIINLQKDIDYLKNKSVNTADIEKNAREQIMFEDSLGVSFLGEEKMKLLFERIGKYSISIQSGVNLIYKNGLIQDGLNEDKKNLIKKGLAKLTNLSVDNIFDGNTLILNKNNNGVVLSQKEFYEKEMIKTGAMKSKDKVLDIFAIDKLLYTVK